MDTATLVDVQIADGQKLIEQLALDGFDVSVAFWLKFKSGENDPWFFYVVSNRVDEVGLQAAYRAVHKSVQKISAPWGPFISRSELRLVGVNDPIGKDVRSIQKQYSDRRPIRDRDVRLANAEIEEVYIYPPMPKAIRNSTIDENVKRFIDEGWELDGEWGDGYPCVRKGSNQVGFLYRIRVDEQMTPEKVPYLEGERPLPRS
jgi:hypothetical protein